jgi:hypothetical protein
VLARAAQAVQGQPNPAAPAKPDQPAGSLPYDRDAATRAIELFIEGHKDQAAFRDRLLSFIKKQSH